ncbi:MAG: hypothetical protein EXQ55_10700 [Acidobacteria bacterium]|nr:hypothetical protein [Acidobacteriota bacterium]
MAIRILALTSLLLLLIAATASSAHAQTISAEIDVTAGYSGEEIRAAASQVRLFGEMPGGARYFAEASWGGRWAGDDPVVGGSLIGVDPIGSDVFGAAYPYKRKLQLIEVYAERYFSPRGALFGVRAGQYRTPFGIYTRSDYGYSGFVRAPLIRYDGYFALSNNWMERGAAFTAGLPQLFVEAGISRPHDVGTSQRRAGTDQSARVQGYYRALIVGVSHARSNPYLPARFARGRQAFSGVDFRWTSSVGVQIRGEAIKGHSYEGVSTAGWYVDGIVHHVGMGPFTAVVRGESLTTRPRRRTPAPRAARRWAHGFDCPVR